MKKDLWFTLFCVVCCLGFFSLPICRAADYCPKDSAELLQNLDTARYKSEDFTIYLEAGQTYSGDFSFDALYTTQSVTILGGYNSGCTDKGTGASIISGSLQVESVKNLVVKDVTFKGGNYGLLASVDGDITVKNIVAKENSYGGVSLIADDVQSKNLVTFENNTIQANGSANDATNAGGVEIWADEIVFIGNTVNGNHGDTDDSYLDAGGAKLHSTSFFVDKNNFVDNTGGGVFLELTSATGADASYFTRNGVILTKSVSGTPDKNAAVYIFSKLNDSSLTIEKNIILQNDTNGGLVIDTPTIQGTGTVTVNILGNEISNTNNDAGILSNGEGVHPHGNGISISNATSGADLEITIKENTICGNAGYGITVDTVNANSDLVTIRDNTIQNNGDPALNTVADKHYAGGIYALVKNLSIEGNIIKDNQNLDRGAGITVWGAGETAAISKNRISGSSSNIGGALYISELVGKVSIYSNLIEKNKAGSKGGAVYRYSGSWSAPSSSRQFYLMNNTFVENTADKAAGVYLAFNADTGYADDAFIYNNLFWKNTADTYTDLHLSYTNNVSQSSGSGGTADIQILNNSFDTSGSGTYIYPDLTLDQSNLNAPDPVFNTEIDGYFLTDGSPMIDAGYPNTLNLIADLVLDYHKQTRNGTVDIGAVEYAGKNGQTLVPAILVTPDSHTFPDTSAGFSSWADFTVANTGGDDLIISGIKGISPPFYIAGTTCQGAAVVPGGTCGIEIGFLPSDEGVFSTDMVISSNAFLNPDASISLAGQSPLGTTVSGPLQVDIKADSQDTPLVISEGQGLSISYSLFPGTYTGQSADWWLAAYAFGEFFHYDLATGTWYQGLDCSCQEPLAEVADQEILSNIPLPAGDYIFFFGIDLTSDCALTSQNLSLDYVEVSITQ